MTTRAEPDSSATDLFARAEDRRLEAARRLSLTTQRRFGQYFTPAQVAERIAAQPRLDQSRTISVLDPGAGVGILVAALVKRILRERSDLAINVTAVEIDRSFSEPLRATLEDCKSAALAAGAELHYEIIAEDFISWGTGMAIGTLDAPVDTRGFDIIIQNPPYAKLSRYSPVRSCLKTLGTDAPNLYAAFLAVSIHLLAPCGQLVAITPRSFCNGTYFRTFRRSLLSTMALDRICVFHERGTLFSESSVLQETIIFSSTRGLQPEKIVVATGRSHSDSPHERTLPYEEVVQTDDPEMFIRVSTDIDDDAISRRISKLPARLDDLQLQVSTGRVVDFRATEYLRMKPQKTTVPLIYPHHFRDGRINWPSANGRKPNAILRCPDSEKLLLPAGTYVLVKRLSSKEEARRVVPTVCHPQDIAAAAVGFENHLNVFHWANQGIDESLAVGMAGWLGSSTLDLYFRQFSGHTQINATDLRNMRYPAKEVLVRLGQAIDIEQWPGQDELDELVEYYVFDAENSTLRGAVEMNKSTEGIVTEARELLTALNFDAERSNERSALVLLALAQLRPNDHWVQAANPMLRTLEIMDFLRQHHGRDYKPNTRETIRRQTLHQFVDAGLIAQNPDQPDRPINSPRSCYQLTARATGLLQQFQTAEFNSALREYLAELPGIQERYAAKREMMRIPVTLPDGEAITLSPGGQNTLIRDVLDKFCPLFTPGGKALYIGDAEDKFRRFEKEEFEKLGLSFDSHGKMPDLVIHFRKEDWLVLFEAASSHGPIDAKRHGELQTLFAASTAGLVFVSCFPTRAEMRKYLKDIAWETEVWCADAETHMIHFNGERFLGPYPVESNL